MNGLASPDIDARRDGYDWAFAQARALREGPREAVDAEGIARELEKRAGQEVRELGARLLILLSHLMKWQGVPDLRGRAWAATIDEQRREIRRALEDSPSLRPRLDALARAAHGRATRRAARETGYPRDHFPWAPTYAVEQLLDDGFWPTED